MKRNILVTAIAVSLSIGSGSLQASTCQNCRRYAVQASSWELAGLSGWQQFNLLLPMAFMTIRTMI